MMAICENCGMDHHPEIAAAGAEIEVAEAMAEGAEGAAHEEARADVEVARIEGETAVELRKIDAKIEAGWQEERVVRMEGELSGMREVLDRLVNPPAPDPAPEPEPVTVIEDGPPAPEEKQAPPATPKRKPGWWG